jgi:hypothetical protein
VGAALILILCNACSSGASDPAPPRNQSAAAEVGGDVRVLGGNGSCRGSQFIPGTLPNVTPAGAHPTTCSIPATGTFKPCDRGDWSCGEPFLIEPYDLCSVATVAYDCENDVGDWSSYVWGTCDTVCP